jgi:ubiquinone/menaquinone biosynthesis C-methylase UbiE
MNFWQMLRDRRNRHQVYGQPDFWNRKAQTLDGHAVSLWANNHLNSLYHAELLQLLEKELPNVRGLKVLDLGCGTGRFSRWFAKGGAKVTGVDFAEKPLEIARNLCVGDNPCYVQGSMFELPFRGDFDIVFSCAAITMACSKIEELQKVAAEAHRVLCSGGRLVLIEPVHRGFLSRTLDLDTRSFLCVFKNAGFDCSPVRHLYFWPMRLALAYLPFPRWLTVPIYYTGHIVMRLFSNRWGGDYKAIFAVRT